MRDRALATGSSLHMAWQDGLCWGEREGVAADQLDREPWEAAKEFSFGELWEATGRV